MGPCETLATLFYAVPCRGVVKGALANVKECRGCVVILQVRYIGICKHSRNLFFTANLTIQLLPPQD
jgi:hypothetical protein